MKVEINCPGSYAMAVCTLAYQEELFVEREAMVAMSGGISVAASTGGHGVVKAAIRKKLTNETFFMGRYRAEVGDGCWLALAPKFPGDVGQLHITEGKGYLVESGGLLAHTAGIEPDVRFAGLANIVLREGATMMRLRGEGLALIASYGGMQRVPVLAGETVIVDTGHIVAFSEGMRLRVGPITNVVSSQLIGEGFVGEFTGPGELFIQTRAEASLRSWLIPNREQNER